MKQIDLVDLSSSVTNSGLLVFEHLFKFNSQKHQSQCMYRPHYCYLLLLQAVGGVEQTRRQLPRDATSISSML